MARAPSTRLVRQLRDAWTRRGDCGLPRRIQSRGRVQEYRASGARSLPRAHRAQSQPAIAQSARDAPTSRPQHVRLPDLGASGRTQPGRLATTNGQASPFRALMRDGRGVMAYRAGLGRRGRLAVELSDVSKHGRRMHCSCIVNHRSSIALRCQRRQERTVHVNTSQRTERRSLRRIACALHLLIDWCLSTLLATVTRRRTASAPARKPSCAHYHVARSACARALRARCRGNRIWRLCGRTRRVRRSGCTLRNKRALPRGCHRRAGC